MDIWSEIVKEKVESLQIHFGSSYFTSKWYEHESKVKDLIKLSSAFKIDNEELIRADEAMRNATYNIKIHTEAMAAKVKHHADKWNIKSTDEDMT
jgi:hypothetical protein